MARLTGLAAKMTAKHYRKTLLNKGYSFFENGNFNLNIIGVRNDSGDASRLNWIRRFCDISIFLINDDQWWSMIQWWILEFKSWCLQKGSARPQDILQFDLCRSVMEPLLQVTSKSCQLKRVLHSETSKNMCSENVHCSENKIENTTWDVKCCNCKKRLPTH